MKYLPSVPTYTYNVILRNNMNKKKKKTSWCSIGRGRIIFFSDGQWVEKTYDGYLTTNRFRPIADEDVQLGRTHIKILYTDTIMNHFKVFTVSILLYINV